LLNFKNFLDRGLFKMAENRILPDQHHFEQIRKRLWSGREYGSVSVMVGSGFSLNAEKISQKAESFLLWGQLVDKMKKDLYPNQNDSGSYATSDALKLADEYELVFGRKALEELLVKALPDENYVPGRLHKLFLSLPWSDVFTTNYDTLLERTLPFIHDKKYDVVLTTSDIPSQTKPRIVKLHGSFPSHRPFIISEEDYRTYPKKYAAFVNTVQQSVMENTLCLIGFSGDDPNFLNWIGWVRDNLGSDTPSIYFIGFVNSTQRRTLEARGIIPIDLTPIFPQVEYPGALRYQKALEWTLLNLKHGKSPDIMNWPSSREVVYDTPSEGLPPIPKGPAPLSDLGDSMPNKKDLEKEDLLHIYKIWKIKRQEFPGWVIAPKESRDKIWRYTENWINPILNNLEKLSLEERLLIIFEMNWRIEISLRPLFNHWVDKIAPVINSINPFLKENDSEQQNQLNFYKNKNVDLYTIQECWVELVFSLARVSREDQDQDRFFLWIEKLKLILCQGR
jgi:SIR2-like domain